MIELTHEAIERMEGLTNIDALETLTRASSKIYKDLAEEGWEREEIIAYLMLIVEAADRYTEEDDEQGYDDPYMTNPEAAK